MYFGIYDSTTIQKLNVKGKNPILIRILEPSYLTTGIPYEIDNINKYSNVLELYFDDIINSALQPPSMYTYFSENMALKLNDFILENDFDEIAIHCSAGISRSSAIGICVSKILNNKSLENKISQWKHFIPNQQVLSTFNSLNYKTKTIYDEIIFRNPDIYHFKKNNLSDMITIDLDEER